MTDLEEKIRRRAYQIWLERGRPEGEADRHWEEARRAIEAELASMQNPVAGNPLPAETDEADAIAAIGADAAVDAAITGVAMPAGASRRLRGRT